MSQTYSSERYGTAADTQAPAAGTMGEAGGMGGAMGEGARPRGAGPALERNRDGSGPESDRPMPPSEP